METQNQKRLDNLREEEKKSWIINAHNRNVDEFWEHVWEVSIKVVMAGIPENSEMN